ncbi:hybrid sensor histidine kinase/response regulator [Pyxidicoccus xibeiensis]|uniref:hybrid sensor histidine kinase/response regulator n=1 Tax=Pyxidicoccus xibeiensis TaxID=2906759 RepID=UPI0020A72EEB|nr:PAS domain-containing protein [Pyxidicoccus xibeiensis]MCP3144728.1 PAS domain S-box protein [Pyxidicoccus xibeiensis]
MAAPPRALEASRVWLVDDSPTQLRRARDFLAKHYTVETFSTAEEMLERLTGPPPDVLILDWELPGVSGLDACRFVREHYDDVTLPILMLSSRGAHEDFSVGLQAGANDYVAKPYDDSELLARVAGLLRIRAQGRRLSEREAYLSTTLSSIGDAVIITDPTGHITFLNPVAERVTGWSDADARQRSVTEVFRLIDSASRAPVEDPVSRVLALGTVQGRASPTLLLRKDGSEVPVDDRAAPIRAGANELVGAVLVFRDVTEQTQARRHSEDLAAKVRASEAELRVLLDAIPVLVSFVTPDERYGRVNKAYEDWFGVSQESLRGRKVREVIGEAAYAVLGPYVKRGLQGESFSFEQHSVPYRLGGTRDVKVTFIAQHEKGKPVEGYVALLQDITVQRALEKERERHLQRQQQQAEIEQQLIGIVSHDLRNPLSAILLGAARLNQRADVDPSTRRVAERIYTSCSRAVRMVNDLLDFTQARLGGGIRIAPSPTDLHALSRAVVEEVEAAHPSVMLEVRTTGNAQGLWDADRLSQVIQNLVTNAVKYGEPGRPIEVSTEGDGTKATLCVHNEGPPISPELLSSIFQPLQRGTGAVDMAGRSVGLGLFIVKSIVEAHQGHIEVQSAPGHGTTFIVTLPQQPVVL